MKFDKRICTSGLLAGGLAAALPAYANLALEEVVVTAQKRDESLVEVPISISNFGAENIAQTGVRQLQEVAEFVPNLSISSGTDFTSSVSIRGVGANSRNIGFDTRVGVYLDGVYLGQSPALNQELLALERIEVLRGPQGTLFGKNTVAGAINLISKKPAEELTTTLGFELGNFNSRQYSASIDLPLSDTVFTKFAVNQQLRDGWIRNTETGNDINEQDALAYRGQLLWLPGDKWQVSLSVDGMNTERLSYTGEPITDSLGNSALDPATVNNELALGLDPFEQRDVYGASMIVDYDLDSGYAIRSITAYRETEIHYINDTDYAPLDVGFIDYRDEYQQSSQELQLISPDDGVFKYVAGLYLYGQEGSSVRIVQPGTVAVALFGADPERPVITDGEVETESYALFFNGTWDINELWTLGFGARWSEETKDVDWLVDGSGAPIFGIATGTVDDSRTDKEFTPTVNLSYALGDASNVYIKYSSGYKSGGFNLDFVGQNDLEAGIEFDKETVDSYEIGVKGTALEQRLSFAFSAFLSRFDNYQVNQFIDLGEGRTSISIRNAAEVETKGAELELTYLASENLKFNLALGVLDGEYLDYPGGGIAGADVSGNSLPNVSDFNGSASMQYYYPLENLDAEVLFRLDYSYRDDFYTDANNTETRTLANGDVVSFGQVEAYQLLNARLSLQQTDSRWLVALWAKNLLDEDYLSNTNRDFLGTLRHFAGLPRTAGIEVEYTF